MVSWIARGLLILAGIVTSWFVAKDAANFGVVQGMVAVALLALMVAVLAFWPVAWTRVLNRLTKAD